MCTCGVILLTGDCVQMGTVYGIVKWVGDVYPGEKQGQKREGFHPSATHVHFVLMCCLTPHSWGWYPRRVASPTSSFLPLRGAS